MQKSKIIYFLGPDGSGKTFLAKKLLKNLNQDYQTKYLWLRYNHFFAKGINLFGRIFRLTEIIEYKHGIKVGYHYYYKSKIMVFLYSLAIIVDTYLTLLLKIYPRLLFNQVLVIDRFALDTIIDLSIDFNDDSLFYKWQGKMLRKCLPSKSIILFISTKKDIIVKRNKSVFCDKNYKKRYQLYQKLSRCINCYQISNNSTCKSTIVRIEKIINYETK